MLRGSLADGVSFLTSAALKKTSLKTRGVPNAFAKHSSASAKASVLALGAAELQNCIGPTLLPTTKLPASVALTSVEPRVLAVRHAPGTGPQSSSLLACLLRKASRKVGRGTVCIGVVAEVCGGRAQDPPAVGHEPGAPLLRNCHAPRTQAATAAVPGSVSLILVDPPPTNLRPAAAAAASSGRGCRQQLAELAWCRLSCIKKAIRENISAARRAIQTVDGNNIASKTLTLRKPACLTAGWRLSHPAHPLLPKNKVGRTKRRKALAIFSRYGRAP